MLVVATPPYNLPDAPLIADVLVTDGPMRILNVVADVVPATILCLNVPLIGDAPVHTEVDVAAKAPAVLSWNKAMDVPYVPLVFPITPSNDISKMLVALVGVIVTVITSNPSVF